MIDTEHVVQRFLKYVSFDTQSDEDNDAVCPSTPGQLVFAKALAEELKAIGLSDVTLDEHGYIMATLPANGAEGPVVGFISHVDTSPDASGKDIKPVRVTDYDGKDVVLNEAEGIVFSTKAFPEVLKYKGQDILFTDGTTLLGADDKAGITAIVSAMEYLIQHPDIAHGTIRIGFTPDEETGRSAALFDVKQFAAAFAYTVDGGELGGLEYENFNAANPVITFHGRSVHTGDAKGKMVNALSIAAEWQQLLPAGEKPEYTEGHEGFFHVYKLNGDVETCTMHMLVRLAKEAMAAVGVTPQVAPIRGGTDGAQLSFRGLPCPNLFTGGANFHGRYEYLPIPSLVKACETVIEIAKRAAQRP